MNEGHELVRVLEQNTTLDDASDRGRVRRIQISCLGGLYHWLGGRFGIVVLG